MNRPWVTKRALAGIMSALVLSSLLTSCGGDKSIVEPEPPASLSELFGPVLYKADGDSVGIEAVDGKAIIAIYFSARWCPACAGFTPQLLSAYQELQQNGRSFEVVLVSLDDSSQEMFAHMMDYDMPWVAVPYGGEKADSLVRRYAVAWIPTLIVIDGQGQTISLNGREDVGSKGAGAYEDWLAKGA